MHKSQFQKTDPLWLVLWSRVTYNSFRLCFSAGNVPHKLSNRPTFGLFGGHPASRTASSSVASAWPWASTRATPSMTSRRPSRRSTGPGAGWRRGWRAGAGRSCVVCPSICSRRRSRARLCFRATARSCHASSRTLTSCWPRRRSSSLRLWTERAHCWPTLTSHSSGR